MTPAEMALARELNLPREFQVGDVYAAQWDADATWWMLTTSDQGVLAVPQRAAGKGGDGYVWCPSLDQALELLEETEGIWCLTRTGSRYTIELVHPDGEWGAPMQCSTPLEAVYRALLAVNARDGSLPVRPSEP